MRGVFLLRYLEDFCKTRGSHMSKSKLFVLLDRTHWHQPHTSRPKPNAVHRTDDRTNVRIGNYFVVTGLRYRRPARFDVVFGFVDNQHFMRTSHDFRKTNCKAIDWKNKGPGRYQIYPGT